MTMKQGEPAIPATLAARLLARATATRVIVGICGAPGAGKSTLAALLADPAKYAYDGTCVIPTYGELVGGQIDLLAQVTAACIHDAVVLTALAWTALG